MNEILTWLLDVVQNVDPVLRTIIAGIAVMLETSVLVGLVVPGDTMVIVAGTAVASPVEGVVLAAAIVVGALIGESLGFWLGRYFGPRIRASRLGQKLGERNWERADRYLRRRGGPAIFLSRFLPVLHSLVPLTVGMSGYSYRRFLAWTTPACVVWASLYVTVAASAAGTYRELSDRIHGAGYIFVGILVAFIVLVFIGKKIIERLERRHLADETAPLESVDGDVKD
ncbi:DedA family protein [Microbacterium testaceum]|uniref:DedA family protein n=1 Tax=Microbacterium testaceum TaxID=2033 RepID=UPI00243590C1|nr:DedA family protein [Microbacterium testaceum]